MYTNTDENIKISMSELEDIINLIPVAICIEQKNRILYNRKIEKIFNTNGKDFSSFVELVKFSINEDLPDLSFIKEINNILNSSSQIVNKVIKLSQNRFLSLTYLFIKSKDIKIWLLEDVTESIRKLEKLTESEELFKTLAETSAAGIFLHKGKLLYVNPALCEITEYTKDELLSMNAIDLIHDNFKKKVKDLIIRRLKGDKTKHVYEVKIITKSGKQKWIQIASSAVMYKGSYAGIGTVIDITDRKEYEEKLKQLATYDSLTGLYNRYMIEEFLEKEIEKSKRHNIPLSVIMCDIDDFKKINDTYGHMFGDKVLKELARIMKENLRKSDAIGRWGGEEFIIIAPYTNVYGAQRLAEKIKTLIENTQIEDISVTISCGVAEYRYSESLKDLFKRVDEALYLAKKKGKNTVEVAL